MTKIDVEKCNPRDLLKEAMSTLLELDISLSEEQCSCAKNNEPANSMHRGALWLVNNDNYFENGNFFARDQHIRYDSADSFLSGMSCIDPEYCRIVNWCWREGAGCDDDWVRPVNRPDTYLDGVFTVQYIMLGKAKLMSAEVRVCRADEPALRVLLSRHAKANLVVWEGL